MKKMMLFIMKFYFKVLSRISPKIAARQTLNLFQKPNKRALKDNELDFYNRAKHFKLYYSEENLDAYEIGSENENLIILVHGWGSNIGRLSKIAFKLENEGFRVVGINFPAHGNSKLKATNMIYSKNALVNLIKHLNPQKPFSIVSHSFGSGVSALALKEMGIEVNQLVFLTSANQFSEIFLDFKKLLSLNNKTFDAMNTYIKSILGFDFMDMKVSNFLKEVNYRKLLLIHDKFDKMLPYHNSVQINKVARNSELMTLENKGHSGMLFDKKVIDKIIVFLKEKF